MQASFVLTVSASKRLIAHGVMALPSFTRALAAGTIAIVKGTTNAYLAELVTGRPLDKLGYARGRVTAPGATWGEAPDLPDLVLRHGAPVDLTLEQALEQMGPGDIYVKGANALQPDRQAAGVLVGSPTAGTLGLYRTLGRPRQVELVIPVGLEKLISGEIAQAAAALGAPQGSGPVLVPVQGTIVTEIEALQLCCGVAACQVAAGGVLGAEGSVRLAVTGSPEALAQAERLVASLQHQPPFPA